MGDVNQELKDCAQRLVDKLKEVHSDSRYLGVYSMAAIHGMPYDGPTYEQELKDLTKLLEEM